MESSVAAAMGSQATLNGEEESECERRLGGFSIILSFITMIQ